MSTSNPIASSLDLIQARKIAIEAAEAAGQLLQNRSSGDFLVEAKGTKGDVVTTLDTAAEELIKSRILDRYPDHQIDAEESGVTGATNSSWTWLVDPLDGTNNILIGLPVCAVGITLCMNDIPVISVLHEPLTKRTWWASRGQGAYGPEGKKLKCFSRRVARNQFIFAWSQGYEVAHDDPIAIASKLVLDRYSRRVLQLWAPLISWAMLARGDIDGIVGYRAGPLDLHPGVLLATEAGIQVVDFFGEPFEERYKRREERNFLAAAPRAIPRLLELMQRAISLGDVVHSVL